MVGQSKKDYLGKIKDRYRHAGRKHKKLILDEFCEICGHHRKHAIRLLSQDARKKKKNPGRPPKHGNKEKKVIENIWLASDRPCASRLVSMISIWLPYYENREGHLEADTRENLLNIKERTLDRLLKPSRKKYGSRGLSGTRKGTYLKHKIPIKINHSEVLKPGYMATDTVAHCGGSLEGNFVWTLTFTDIFSEWTKNHAVWNKGEAGVFKALKNLEENLPFLVLGLHSDNGGEFINHHLYRFYKNRERPVEQTRGRPRRSNDNPHVEQKNWTHVRCLLGYSRIDNPWLVKVMNELYRAANLLNNFFCANRKLIKKERRGSRYYKKYDQAQTPCDRLMKSGTLSEAQKTYLTEVKINLDPYKLRQFIDTKQRKILEGLR